MGITNKNAFPIFLMGLTASWTFFSSYIYHASKNDVQRERNRIVDKTSIYIMIAGNGTAINLLSSTESMSVTCCLLLILISGFFVVRFCLNSLTSETFMLTSYLLLGWLAVMPASGLFAPSKFTDMPHILFLLGGGAAYSIGVVFYIRDKKWHHSVWHLFTMLGFTFHFYGAYLCLVTH